LYALIRATDDDRCAQHLHRPLAPAVRAVSPPTAHIRWVDHLHRRGSLHHGRRLWRTLLGPSLDEDLERPAVAKLVLQALPVLLVLDGPSLLAPCCANGSEDGVGQVLGELQPPVGDGDVSTLVTAAREDQAVPALVRMHAPSAVACLIELRV